MQAITRSLYTKVHELLADGISVRDIHMSLQSQKTPLSKPIIYNIKKSNNYEDYRSNLLLRSNRLRALKNKKNIPTNRKNFWKRFLHV